MYKHILIPTDGSELSTKAVAQGIRFAKSIGASVTALTVSPNFHTFSLQPGSVSDTPDSYQSDCEAHARTVLGPIEDAARSAGIAFEAAHVYSDHPHEAIIQSAKRKDCDLIFMASHGRRGISALLLGSETAKVLTHTKIPVLVCR